MSNISGAALWSIAKQVYTTLDESSVVTTAGTVTQAEFGITMSSEAQDRAGFACHYPFIGGIEHEVVVLVRSTSSTEELDGTLVVEAHGSLPRFQNAKTEVAFPELSVADLAEISTRVDVDGDLTRLVCRFTPVTSMPSWVYLWWTGTDSIAVQSCSISQVSTDRASATVDFDAVTLEDGTCFALDTLLPLNDTLTVHFGVAHPTKQVSRVDLLTVRPAVAAVHHGSVSTWSNRVSKTAKSHAASLGMTISPLVHSSPNPIGSPALMATGRVDWAWRGHSLSALFSDYLNLRHLSEPDAERIVECSVVVTWNDQSTTLIDLRNDNLQTFMSTARSLTREWFDAQTQRGGRVLEIGGRGGNAALNRSILSTCDYVSLDIVGGPNVDFVGDAHDLLATFERQSFDAVFAHQVFEHLHAPWKAVLEINRILKLGGSVHLVSPSALPLHSEPWDFFRFSDHSWHSLFNADTGFTVEQTELVSPMLLTPRITAAPFIMMNAHSAFMMSCMVATKVSEPQVTWETDPVGDSAVWYPESGIVELRNQT